MVLQFLNNPIWKWRVGVCFESFWVVGVMKFGAMEMVGWSFAAINGVVCCTVRLSALFWTNELLLLGAILTQKQQQANKLRNMLKDFEIGLPKELFAFVFFDFTSNLSSTVIIVISVSYNFNIIHVCLHTNFRLSKSWLRCQTHACSFIKLGFSFQDNMLFCEFSIWIR